MDLNAGLIRYPDTLPMAEIADYLNGLDHPGRLRAIRSLGPLAQSHLFERAQGFRPLDLGYFVPESHSPLAEVIHHGRNSLPPLPTIRFFQKRFCRPDRETDGPELWGYNEQKLKDITGPGYFVAKPSPEAEVVIDYFAQPPGKPEAWPEILGNDEKLSRVIYYHTRDYMRGVSDHVSVGRAVKDGVLMNNWFVLCREDSPAAT